jgi:hypothetical protein
MHTGFAIREVDADHGISNLLITGHTKWFNSVPGHHVFNRLAKIVKPLSKHKMPFIVGGTSS